MNDGTADSDIDPSDTFDTQRDDWVRVLNTWTPPPPPTDLDEQLADFEHGCVIEPMVAGERHHVRSATRFSSNHDWTRRGDNTKYKEQK